MYNDYGMNNTTLGEKFLDYYTNHKDSIPGSTLIKDDPNDLSYYNKIISLGALDFLTWLTGDKLYQDITDNNNLNAEIIDQFAQTFVRKFWTYQPGYDSDLVFAARLRAFFDEYLPIWAQYYKELVINKGGYITNRGSVIVSGTNSLHYTGSGSSNGNNSSDVSTVGENSSTNYSNTDEKSNGDTITNTRSDSDTKGSVTSRSTDNKNTEASEEGKNNQFQETADTPQNQIATPFQGAELSYVDENGKTQNGIDPTSNYQFDYASNAQANSTLTGKNTKASETDTNQTTSSTDTTNTTNSNGESISKDESTTSTKGGSNATNNTSSHTVNRNSLTQSDEHNQNASNNNATQTDERNVPLYELAHGLNSIVDGAYGDLFKKAKKYGLFMLDYA